MARYALLNETSNLSLQTIAKIYEIPDDERFKFHGGVDDFRHFIPDYVKNDWVFIHGKPCSPLAAKYWETNLFPRGLPPPPIEEQLAREELRPQQQGEIAVAHVMSYENFSVKIYRCDVNNTLVMDLKNSIISELGISNGNLGVLASTNHWNSHEMVQRYKNIKTSTPILFETVNILSSVLDGKRHGQNPSVGVSEKNRQILSDYTRLADILGTVVVFRHNPIPSNPWSPDFIDIIIDIVVSVYGGRVK